MLALLIATLIGVFITPDGIVIGADTALSNLGGRVGSQQKYCVTGARSVATMQGQYWLEDTVTKATVELNNRFRDLCSRVASAATPMTLQQQADHIANALRPDLIAFLQQMPAEAVVRTYGSSPMVARVAVAGYGERGPESVVVGLGIATERTTNRWEVQVRPLSRLAFSGCGVRFHGQESVVSALQTDTGARIPQSELQQPDVARLAMLLKGECGDASTQTAAAMFLQAVRLTITLGPGFSIPPGAVSLPVDVITIPRDGTIDVQRLTSW